MSKGEPDSSDHFAQELKIRMLKLGLSIKDVANESGATYEHIRKLCKGLALPSPQLMHHLAKIVGFKVEDAEKMVVADHINAKFGKMPAMISGKNPELLPIENVWGSLNAGQKQDLVLMAQSMAKRNQLERNRS